METTFVALYRIVFVGIWQTLDGFLTGIWAFGVGRLAWQKGASPSHYHCLPLVRVVILVADRITGIHPGS